MSDPEVHVSGVIVIPPDPSRDFQPLEWGPCILYAVESCLQFRWFVPPSSPHRPDVFAPWKARSPGLAAVMPQAGPQPPRQSRYSFLTSVMMRRMPMPWAICRSVMRKLSQRGRLMCADPMMSIRFLMIPCSMMIFEPLPPLLPDRMVLPRRDVHRWSRVQSSGHNSPL